jgi:hypothetical protein
MKMSGGGKIIEKMSMVLTDEDHPEFREDVVRYWLSTDVGRSWPDETCVYAEPQDDEPQLGETMWWGAGKEIYWGPDDKKRLTKVGYSHAPSQD